MNLRFVCTLLIVWVPFQGMWVHAQLPSESLLIINGSHPDAHAVAMDYAEKRGFPSERILTLTPDKSFFTTEDGSFRWHAGWQKVNEVVLDPVKAKIDALNDPTPTALLFSPGWPTRVNIPGNPPVSLTSYVGFLGQMPEKGIKHGQAISPLYRHPDDLSSRKVRPLKYPLQDNRENGVHPAAMLGVFDEVLDKKAVMKALERAVNADHTRPEAGIAFVTNTNVRSTARADQFAPATEQLTSRGVEVSLGNNKTKIPRHLAGVMTGSAGVNMRPYENKLVPGSFAEHLTSFAATFDQKAQTKCTAWIAAGAAGSVGTVTEPYAIWTKFPRAEVFSPYLSGHTLLESVTQSIASPYQSLILGDPLCRPWGKALTPLNLHTRWEDGQLHIRAEAGYDPDRTDHHLFVNGRRLPGNGPTWTLSPADRGEDNTLELLLHARYNWSPPETGWIKKALPNKPE